jgi:hypothetical protein
LATLLADKEANQQDRDKEAHQQHKEANQQPRRWPKHRDRILMKTVMLTCLL